MAFDKKGTLVLNGISYSGSGSSGSGGTSDYNELSNKPTLNDKELVGDKFLTLADIIGTPFPSEIKNNTIVRYADGREPNWNFDVLSADIISSRVTIGSDIVIGNVQNCLNTIGIHIADLETTVGQANALLEGAL